MAAGSCRVDIWSPPYQHVAICANQIRWQRPANKARNTQKNYKARKNWKDCKKWEDDNLGWKGKVKGSPEGPRSFCLEFSPHLVFLDIRFVRCLLYLGYTILWKWVSSFSFLSSSSIEHLSIFDINISQKYFPNNNIFEIRKLETWKCRNLPRLSPETNWDLPGQNLLNFSGKLFGDKSILPSGRL